MYNLDEPTPQGADRRYYFREKYKDVQKSQGHVMFLDSIEYLHGPDNNYYSAPVYNLIGTDGYRQGARFFCTSAAWPKHMQDMAIQQADSKKG